LSQEPSKRDDSCENLIHQLHTPEKPVVEDVPDVQPGNIEKPPADDVPELQPVEIAGSNDGEGFVLPEHELTERHVSILNHFSPNKWKFLVAVVVFDAMKTATRDHLDALFAEFPTADDVEDRGWFDVLELMEEKGIEGGEPLARSIARLSYQYLEAVPGNVAPSSFPPAFLDNFTKKTAFWAACHGVVFGNVQ
jgi:hypothetical protein